MSRDTQYITAANLNDDLLKPLATETEIAEANRFLWGEAVRKGAGTIRTPLSYKVERLAVCKALELVAMRKAVLSPKTMMSSDGIDAYELKRRAYAQERRELQAELTAVDFTGTEAAYNPCIDLYRS